MGRDRVFEQRPEKQFEFDERVAAVFDDMLTRSIPLYETAQSLSCDLLARLLPTTGRLYDLGCSTASTLLELWRRRPNGFEYIGLDNSAAMLERAGRKIAAYQAPILLIDTDITAYPFLNASAFIANYTLQFIRPLKRSPLVKRLYDALEPGGLFLFSEKTVCEDKRLAAQMIAQYHDYKRTQGYSDNEIAQKREALENVLIPYTAWENRSMVMDAGFSSVEILFKYNNFATFLAVK